MQSSDATRTISGRFVPHSDIPWRTHEIEPATLVGRDGLVIADFNSKSHSAEENQTNADYALMATTDHYRLVRMLTELLDAFELNAEDMDIYEYETIVDGAKNSARHLLRQVQGR